MLVDEGRLLENSELYCSSSNFSNVYRVLVKYSRIIVTPPKKVTIIIFLGLCLLSFFLSLIQNLEFQTYFDKLITEHVNTSTMVNNNSKIEFEMQKQDEKDTRSTFTMAGESFGSYCFEIQKNNEEYNTIQNDYN